MSTMSARDAILSAVRAARPPQTSLPEIAQFPAAEGDLTARFAESSRVGGAGVVEGPRSDLNRMVREGYPEAARIVSLVGGVPGTAPLPDDPHDLAHTDLFVCEGVLGVAENGAVWLPASRLGGDRRAALFLATSVVIVLDRRAVVPDFHAAYATLDVAAEPFGAFVAGPSKTADIEQSLVVGAHGPKSLTVVLVS
jgi:L-lactate dehydrogenase complex protein LldG